jgi:hypothetical protein
MVGRRVLGRAIGSVAPVALVAGGLAALFVVACAVGEENGTADAGALEGGPSPSSDGALAADATEAASPACKDGRRRCVGLELQICDVGAWIELQTCVQGESCDVAVGICRAVDAGPDSASDAPHDAGGDGG